MAWGCTQILKHVHMCSGLCGEETGLNTEFTCFSSSSYVPSEVILYHIFNRFLPERACACSTGKASREQAVQRHMLVLELMIQIPLESASTEQMGPAYVES